MFVYTESSTFLARKTLVTSLVLWVIKPIGYISNLAARVVNNIPYFVKNYEGSFTLLISKLNFINNIMVVRCELNKIQVVHLYSLWNPSHMIQCIWFISCLNFHFLSFLNYILFINITLSIMLSAFILMFK